VCFLLVWLCVLFYLLGPIVLSSENEERMNRQLVEANQELQRLAAKNNELRDMLRNAQQADAHQRSGPEVDEDDAVAVAVAPAPASSHTFSASNGPLDEYEVYRRRLTRDVRELWRYLSTQLEEIAKNSPAANKTLADTRHRYHVIMSDIDSMTANDGHDEWRSSESRALSDLVQRRLRALQNPADCSKARKLVCKLNKGCGYGCQIHHAVYCFIVAYGTERTLVLKSKGWRYNKGGFEEIFQPLSQTCNDPQGSGGHSMWPGQPDTQVVDIPIVDSINPRPKFLPPAVPADLADRIAKVHGDPIVWWVSEFLRYILRPQPPTQAMLNDIEAEQGLNSGTRGIPLVGIHIRRTDKVGTEAAFHGVDEYMKHVAEYFDRVEVKSGGVPLAEKRVYVASDDSKVLAECRKKYPGYTFLGDQSISKSAAVNSRYNLASLKGVISDIHMLSQSDYLVCTFSSQVCRIAYEIQQQRYVDGAANFKSLDDIWYFGGQNDHQQEALMTHKAANKDEIDLKAGETLGVAGNHWNGFNKGRNYANNRIGLYPEYKTKEKLRVVEFPTYPNVS